MTFKDNECPRKNTQLENSFVVIKPTMTWKENFVYKVQNIPDFCKTKGSLAEGIKNINQIMSHLLTSNFENKNLKIVSVKGFALKSSANHTH